MRTQHFRYVCSKVGQLTSARKHLIFACLHTLMCMMHLVYSTVYCTATGAKQGSTLGTVRAELLDLASLNSVQAFANRYKGQYM
jgi:hypothetical protein